MSLHGNYVQPMWLRILIQISMMINQLSDWLARLTIRSEELCTEIAETRKLREAAPPPGHSSFPQFGMLPPELRHMIWEEALPSPRILMLQGPDTSPSRAERVLGLRIGAGGKYTSAIWRCGAKVPAVLHVSSEARAVALRHYHLSFATGGTEPRIYVDFARDVVGLSAKVLESPTARNMLRLTADAARVRHLALAKSSAAGFLAGPMLRSFVAVRDVVVLDSPLWARGVVPPVAQADYEHWVRWQSARGAATWFLGGEDVQAEIRAREGWAKKWKA